MWWLWDLRRWDVVDAGEAAREETGESGGVRSQCWLAELSSRCRRGVGAIISRRSGKGLGAVELVLLVWRRGDSARVDTGLALGG